jgi:hypothetical protein
MSRRLALLALAAFAWAPAIPARGQYPSQGGMTTETVTRYVWVRDPRTGQWVLRQVQETRVVGSNRVGSNVGRQGASFPGSQTQQGQAAGQELFAANLGIYYRQIWYPNGTFGARLTRHPAPNSPAGQLRLEPGDVVYELDGGRFYSPDDVLNHRAQTSISFINVRTSGAQSHWITIP